MEHKYLYDIRHKDYPNEEVCTWDFVQVGCDVRLYYKPNKEIGLGLDFYAFEKTGYICNEATNKNSWDKRYCNGHCIVCGIAYFDGIRHLYYGDEKTDNYGYHYYADLEMVALTLNKLRGLEKKYCRDHEIKY